MPFMNKKDLTILLLATILIVAGVLFFTNRSKTTFKEPEFKKKADLDSDSQKELESSEMEIDKRKTYTAVLNTSKGVVKIGLQADKTPITVNNFISLARKDFYNGTIFHRAIKDFMIQGGDPKGDGTGGPGYQFDDEPFEGEYTRGTVAMANSGPNTNGSQFFILHQDYDLPKNYVIFGKVIEGMEVVDQIAESPTKPNASGEGSVPVEPTKISSVEIIEE